MEWMFLRVERSLSELNGGQAAARRPNKWKSTARSYRRFGSGPLDKGHHLGGITFANDFDFGKARFDVFKISFAQAQFERCHVLFEVTNTFCAGNGHEIVSLGERQLRRRNVFFAGELFDGRREFQICLQRLLSETRLVFPAPIGWVQVLQFLDGTRQEAATERAVRNK